jgi:hypothetical protein
MKLGGSHTTDIATFSSPNTLLPNNYTCGGLLLHLTTFSDIHTLGRTTLDEGSARRRDLCLHNTRCWQQTSIHAPGGIRTRNPSKRAATLEPKTGKLHKMVEAYQGEVFGGCNRKLRLFSQPAGGITATRSGVHPKTCWLVAPPPPTPHKWNLKKRENFVHSDIIFTLSSPCIFSHRITTISNKMHYITISLFSIHYPDIFRCLSTSSSGGCLYTDITLNFLLQRGFMWLFNP